MADTTADQTIHDACREVVSAIRLGRRIGRTVPTALIAKRLQLAVEEAERAAMVAADDSWLRGAR